MGSLVPSSHSCSLMHSSPLPLIIQKPENNVCLFLSPPCCQSFLQTNPSSSSDKPFEINSQSRSVFLSISYPFLQLSRISLLILSLFRDRASCSSGSSQIYYIINASFKLLIFLPLPPQCWDYKHVSTDLQALTSIKAKAPGTVL